MMSLMMSLMMRWLFSGDDSLDVDIPHRLEAKLFKYTLGKLIWMILQPFFYALRPLFVQPKPITLHEVSLGLYVKCVTLNLLDVEGLQVETCSYTCPVSVNES